MIRLRIFCILSAAALLKTTIRAHEESGEWSCDSSSFRIEAEFNPGLITLDGIVDDWNSIPGSEFTLLPALDPDADKEYKSGKMTVKVLHDGRDAFFMLQVDGDYAYTTGNHFMCPSVALMFQIGDSATYHNMGGCNENPSTCNNKTCKGHEVDIMHFSIGSAVPGRIYGSNLVDNSYGNGNDRFGHLVDLYGWNPHCRYYDGKGPSGNVSGAQNDWQGVWWNSHLSSQYTEEDGPYGKQGEKGTYYFEFSRALRTTDRSRQDAQFTIGGVSKMGVAFWYPTNGGPWGASEHYSINCEWVEVEFEKGGSLVNGPGNGPGSSKDYASAFALFLSVVAICVSVFVSYSVGRRKGVPFSQIQMENI